MATAIKTKIIDKVIERLQTLDAINPAAPAEMTITKNAFREYDEDSLPLIRVSFQKGGASQFNNAITYKREDQLNIYFADSGNDDTLDDTLYDAEEAIADFMIQDHNNSGDADSLYHLFDVLEYKGWESNFEKGEIPIGAVMLKFDITYYSNHIFTPDDLETANVKVKPAGFGDDTPIIAEDTIDLSGA